MQPVGWTRLLLEVRMPDWSLLLYSALLTGIVLSLMLTVITTTSGSVAPDMWVSKYPPDIQQKYGPMSPRSARLRPYVAALVFLVTFAIPLLGLFALKTQVAFIPFITAFAFAFIALLVFNLYDLLILDWIFFCTIQPRVMVLPGTEGMAGYRDYRFHFVGFLKGLGFCTVGGLIIAALWQVLQALTA
jgi:hypothetical protein